MQILETYCDTTHDLVAIEVPSDELALFIALRHHDFSERHTSFAVVVNFGATDIEVRHRQVIERQVLVDHVHCSDETHLNCMLDVICAIGCFLEKTLGLAA